MKNYCIPTLKETFPDKRCQIDVRCHSKQVQMIPEWKIFVKHGTGLWLPLLSLHFKLLLTLHSWRAMNVAINQVRVQICDVNPKQPTDLFCIK